MRGEPVRMRGGRSALASLLLPLLLAAGCAVGPDYRRPAVPTPAAFSEQGPWKVGVPRDDLPRGSWWTAFHDPLLDSLEGEAAAASPDLRAAFARWDQSLALARESRAELLPSLSANPSAVRERFSGNRQAEFPATRFSYTTDSYDLPLDFAWQIDLFGEARRNLESARAGAQAQEAAYRSVLLTLQGGVAGDYYSLRAFLRRRQILEGESSLLGDVLSLVQKLRAGGANSDLDLYQARAAFESVQAEVAAADQAIARQRHALAVLVGCSPEGFAVAAEPLGDQAPPAIPEVLPSQLLERRPDIAAAERTLAAANAGIGAAKAAFFPSVGLGASVGYNAQESSLILKGDSREWTLGPFATIPLFRGGALLAGYRAAQAQYQESLASYRSQVLSAFQQVEDGLSDLRFLSEQKELLAAAAEDAHRAEELSTTRYRNGLVSYLEVITAERTELDARLALADAQAQRLQATVLLIEATGGGW